MGSWAMLDLITGDYKRLVCVFAAASVFQVSRLAGFTCPTYLCAQLLLLVKSLRFRQQQQRAIEDFDLSYHSEVSPNGRNRNAS